MNKFSDWLKVSDYFGKCLIIIIILELFLLYQLSHNWFSTHAIKKVSNRLITLQSSFYNLLSDSNFLLEQWLSVEDGDINLSEENDIKSEYTSNLIDAWTKLSLSQLQVAKFIRQDSDKFRTDNVEAYSLIYTSNYFSDKSSNQGRLGAVIAGLSSKTLSILDKKLDDGLPGTGILRFYVADDSKEGPDLEPSLCVEKILNQFFWTNNNSNSCYAFHLY